MTKIVDKSNAINSIVSRFAASLCEADDNMSIAISGQIISASALAQALRYADDTGRAKMLSQFHNLFDNLCADVVCEIDKHKDKTE